MSDSKAMQPLQKTHQSLQQIKITLNPFLTILDQHYNSKSNNGSPSSSSSSSIKNPRIKYDQQQIAEAESAVSLAMGTLRYMANRLKGIDTKGSKKSDPLRMELDKMRKTLVKCKGLRKKSGDDRKKGKKRGSDVGLDGSGSSPNKRKRKEETR